MKKNVFFVAVNYNNTKFTIKYINSVNNIEDAESVKKNIVIIDNNSCTSEIKNLERFIYSYSKKNINLIKNKSNVGYFKALNIGLKSINNYKKSPIIIGNNDLKFKSDFLKELYNINFSNKTLVLAPNIITKDGKKQNPHVIKRVSFLKRIFYRIYFSNYYLGKISFNCFQFIKKINPIRRRLNNSEKSIYIYMGIGACYVLTPNFFKYYDKLDDRVFMWGEEALLANQVKKVGGRILYTPALVVNHYESASTNKMQSKEKYEIIKNSYKIYSRYL